MKKTFGSTLKKLRESQDLSLRGLARDLGISATYLAHLEADRGSTPSEEVVTKMAAALGQDRDAFLALAGLVAKDVQDIIRTTHPAAFATLVRSLSGFSRAEFDRLRKQAQAAKQAKESE